MKKKLIIILIVIVMIVTFNSCTKTNKDDDLASSDILPVGVDTVSQDDIDALLTEIGSGITDDLKVDASTFTNREIELLKNVNDVDLLDFALPDFEGKSHSLTDYVGEVIILNFWAIGCPPCVNELPDFNEVAKKDGVVLVTVAQKNVLGNEFDASYEFIKEFDTVALWDEKLETQSVYPSQYYPHTYIIDRSGTIRFVLNSATYELLDELVSFCDEKFN